MKKNFLATIGTVSLTAIGSSSSIIMTPLTNITKESNDGTHKIQIFLDKEKSTIKNFYNASNFRASFYYLNLTKHINILSKDFKITLHHVKFKNKQENKSDTKYFDSLTADTSIFDSYTSANPENWNDQDFNLYTTTLYSSTVTQGVTKYTSNLAVQITRDTKKEKIFFVWGVYGYVKLGSNQAKVNSEIKMITIKYKD